MWCNYYYNYNLLYYYNVTIQIQMNTSNSEIHMIYHGGFTVWLLGGSKVIPVSSVQKRGPSSRGDTESFQAFSFYTTFTVHSRQS
jgi:hypothetical protein